MFAVKVGLFPSSAAVSDSIPWDSHRNRSHHQSREVVCTSQHPSHWACGLCYLPSTKSSLLLKLLLPGVLPAPTPTCIWRGQMWGALTSMQTCCPFVLNQNKQIHTRTPPNHPPTSFLLPTATPFFLLLFAAKVLLQRWWYLLSLYPFPSSFWEIYWNNLNTMKFNSFKWCFNRSVQSCSQVPCSHHHSHDMEHLHFPEVSLCHQQLSPILWTQETPDMLWSQ